MPPSSESGVRFGPFELRRSQRLLLEGETPVRVGGRALDVLCVLVERAGEVVSREELVRRVWGQVVVEDTSLRVHVAALRKALGDGIGERRYIANVVGRGYSFVGSIDVAVPVPVTVAPVPFPRQQAPTWPARLSRVIGREHETQALATCLAERRFVTIVGHGGMGKTTVALAVAQQQRDRYADGAHFVDLAPLSDPASVPVALASALGLEAGVGDALGAVLAALKDQRALLVLDNCEHVIHAAAGVAEAVLRGARGVHLIATSREPLDAEGEWVHRLAALRAPAAHEALSLEEALVFPAIQLFAERASAGSDGFALSDTNLPLVRHLCLRLDGMPLALELAASRVESLGVAGLVASLDDMFRVLTRGRRTVLPRHQTLRALLDWSHELLDERERLVLRRLAVFGAGFTMEDAAEVARCETLSHSSVMDCLLSLSAKSLVTVREGTTPTFVLLHVTRRYALEKLADSGERDTCTQRHDRMQHDSAGAARRAAAIHTNSRVPVANATDHRVSAGGPRALSATNH